MSGYVLETEGVSFRYEKKDPLALDGVSVRIKKGVKTAIIGANGAGKSTLFGILNALYRPDEGKVFYDGEPMSYRRRNLMHMRSDVCVLFQNPDDMIFRPIVEQDVAFGPENMRLPKEEVEKRVSEALFSVGMLEFRKKSAMRLSYGQRKRVTIAGVLAMHPKVLIMDEPTAGLDPQMSCEVMELAEQLHREGTTVIMSSHDTDLTYSWADEIIVMRHGKCVYSGEPEPFYSDKAAVYMAGLMPPKVFVMNDGMALGNGFPASPYPKTNSQLVAKIADRKADCGLLYVIVAEDGCTASDIGNIMAEEGLGNAPVGIYGRSARRVKDIQDLDVRYEFNAPESCLMRCMEGKDAVLVCDPSLVESVQERIAFLKDTDFGGVEAVIERCQ